MHDLASCAGAAPPQAPLHARVPRPAPLDLRTILAAPSAQAAAPSAWARDLAARTDEALGLNDRHARAAEEFCQWFGRQRTLLGLIGRPGPARMMAVRRQLRAIGLDQVIGDDLLARLLRRRLLVGLLRRTSAIRQLLVSAIVRPHVEHAITHTLAGLVGAAIRTAEAVASSGAAAPSPMIGFADALTLWSGDIQIFADAAFPGRCVAACFQHARLPAGAEDAWVARIRRGWQLPATAAELTATAEEILAHGLFDAAAYGASIGLVAPALSTAMHYLLVGDPLGISPSDGFDPAYYARRYPDIDDAGLSRLLQYIRHGCGEARHPRPYRTTPAGTPGPRSGRESILVIGHEASRTGAPILTWNLAARLAARYDVVVLILGPGPLIEDFAALGVETHGPIPTDRRHPVDLAAIVQGLEHHPSARGLPSDKGFRFALANSAETRAVIGPCRSLGIPTILLVHEFATAVFDRAGLRQAFDDADAIVFPAAIVARSATSVHPPLRNRAIHIHPQGQCRLPPRQPGAAVPPSQTIRLETLTAARRHGAFTVLGAGSVNFRKGVDLFIATAAILRRVCPRPIRFIWVGHGYDPDHDMAYSLFLREQTERCGLEDHVTLVNEVPDLDPLYDLADAFLLASRLDPLPNVSIDAASRGLPVVCFRGASGTAEIMDEDQDTASCVVEHLDTAAAAHALLELATDAGHYARVATATRLRAHAVFDMAAYAATIDSLACATVPRHIA